MRSLIRIAFALFLISFMVTKSFAGGGSVRPVKPSLVHSPDIQKLDSFLKTRVSIALVKEVFNASPEEAANSSGRICSCQILNMSSSNYNHRYVALLAEKLNDGSSSAYAIARNRIQKEKKQLKKLFYDKVKVVAEIHGTGSCKSMFYQLRTSDSRLQLYEILNADIH